MAHLQNSLPLHGTPQSPPQLHESTPRSSTSQSAEGTVSPSSVEPLSSDNAGATSSDGASLGRGRASIKDTPKHKEPGTVIRRRGHLKSRLGCFTCKRRRVKCNELRPHCSPCQRLGLVCEYPVTGSRIGSSSSSPGSRDGGGSAASTGPMVALTGLTLEDLRFYHQFLTVAFPTLPLKGSQVWSTCAAMSHSYEFLAHAVLGLGASHLSQNCDVDFTSQALRHRVTAINLVNQQLNAPSREVADADALFATVLCLITQSSLMVDSMADYMTMTRGANLVATTILPDFEQSVFRTLSPHGHVDVMLKMVHELPKDENLIDAFRLSAVNLGPLCKEIYEIRYHEMLVSAITSLRTSSVEAWRQFILLFMMPSLFNNEQFSAFIDPDNHAGQLLMIHMFILDYVAGRFSLVPSDEPKCDGRKRVIIAWTEDVADRLPLDLKGYVQWPLGYAHELGKLDNRYLLSP